MFLAKCCVVHRTRVDLQPAVLDTMRTEVWPHNDLHGATLMLPPNAPKHFFLRIKTALCEVTQ